MLGVVFVRCTLALRRSPSAPTPLFCAPACAAGFLRHGCHTPSNIMWPPSPHPPCPPAACTSFEIANYLNWYLMVEVEDKRHGGMFSRVHSSLIAQLMSYVASPRPRRVLLHASHSSPLLVFVTVVSSPPLHVSVKYRRACGGCVSVLVLVASRPCFCLPLPPFIVLLSPPPAAPPCCTSQGPEGHADMECTV